MPNTLHVQHYGQKIVLIQPRGYGVGVSFVLDDESLLVASTRPPVWQGQVILIAAMLSTSIWLSAESIYDKNRGNDKEITHNKQPPLATASDSNCHSHNL